MRVILSRRTYVERKNRPGCLSILFHTFMTFATGGIWLVGLIIRALLKD